ncbi:conserved hypothetical protein [Methanosalsum zhilinae DSM 4017]|uniref:Uncharacterized protein n=1 Tax=Methanosalsum zhilinae (strain DSM 4017 / NBRC 107636 / OCM 62 / WeN5) TaxID=679901 RepID=F7XQB7_METZD|nr:hypothetical protein [Methanosalsum zhilinae]AEH61579.1 conserved hypothetical protein [Methanosalsum zhilinae DSM 4017]
MKKQHIEILSSVGMVLLLTVLLIAVNLANIPQENIGFVLSLLAFILVTTVVGIKLANIPE